jgi:hypothetical protein
MSLVIVPITLVAREHRHHKPPIGAKFSIGVANTIGRDDSEVINEIVGVCTVGRPVARLADDGYTAEVTRLCTDGTRNACSILYAAAWRAARAMGYRKLITYTLPEEGGASLRAAGMRCIGSAGGGSWSRTSRPRVDTAPTQAKLRWEIEA